jgi:UDP-N-acetylglucosamine--N-acetylmuramyl-(pentapeptide) pyrophosphoryl-undecaprenol N-acetylglucosamine transferase
MLSGGGTGGHIYPAVSIANELRLRYPKSNFLFVGSKDRMEMEKVPQAGYEIEGLWISGIQRKLTVDNLSFPFKLISSLYKSWKLIRGFNPDVVIGTGGFASGPLLFVASKKGIPTLIQEQNSYPGITNKLLSKSVNKICTAFEGLERFFPASKIVLTGNPIRQDLTVNKVTKEDASDYFDLNSEKRTILVLGGSLGARAVNVQVAKILEWVKQNNYQLIWQTGKLYIDDYEHLQGEMNYQGIKIQAFLNRMDMAYAMADVILTRSGAGTISELCVVGKPTIFVPSPNVAEDHQTFNAKALSSKDAAVLIPEKKMDKELIPSLEKILKDEVVRVTLSENIKKIALPNASKDIVNEVEKLLK